MRKNINIMVMGKTGVGKSTLINKVLGYEAAFTGVGQAVTRENQTYSKQMCFNGELCDVHLTDTVGLEVDQRLNEKTISCIMDRLEITGYSSNENDINIVWFCINSNCHRFEQYEATLIQRFLI